MKFDELKVGLKVADRWFPQWGMGKVTILLKTRVVVKYPDGDTTYDKEHVKFLEKGGY